MQIFRLGKLPPADQLIPQLARDEARLRAMGAQAVPVLIETLQDSALVGSAVQSLGVLGETAAPAVPHLLDIVRDARWRASLRVAAMKSLGEIGEPARPAVPYLQQLAGADALNRDQQQLAEAARQALTRIETR